MKRRNLLFLGLFALTLSIGALGMFTSCTVDPGITGTNFVSSTGTGSSSSAPSGGGSDSNYYVLYSDTYTVDVTWDTDGKMDVWNAGYTLESDTVVFGDGSPSLKITVSANAWAGLGLRSHPLDTLIDLSAYSSGSLNFMYKSTKLPTKIGIKGGTLVAHERWITGAVLKSTYGLKDDGTWSSVKIPLSAFVGLNLANVTQYFMFVTDGANHVIGNVYNIDNIYFTTNN